MGCATGKAPTALYGLSTPRPAKRGAGTRPATWPRGEGNLGGFCRAFRAGGREGTSAGKVSLYRTRRRAATEKLHSGLPGAIAGPTGCTAGGWPCPRACAPPVWRQREEAVGLPQGRSFSRRAPRVASDRIDRRINLLSDGQKRGPTASRRRGRRRVWDAPLPRALRTRRGDPSFPLCSLHQQGHDRRHAGSARIVRRRLSGCIRSWVSLCGDFGCDRVLDPVRGTARRDGVVGVGGAVPPRPGVGAGGAVPPRPGPARALLLGLPGRRARHRARG